MPTHPGPWQPSPGPMTSSAQTSGPVFVVYDPDQSGVSTTDFALMCEPTPPAQGVQSTFMRLENIGGAYYIQQLALDFDLTLAISGLLASWSPPLPWPQHAVSWEWDTSDAPTGDYMPSAHYATGVVVTVDLHDIEATTLDVVVDAVPADPTHVIYSGTTGLPTQAGAIPGANLTPISGSLTMPASTSSATLTTSPIDPAYIHDLTATGGSSLAAALRVVLAYDNQRTHVAPPTDTQRRLDATGARLDAVVQWTPPRWRFVFDGLVPLRQFPRDDYLGGAPRQGQTNGPTSVQGSARQGWRATYR